MSFVKFSKQNFNHYKYLFFFVALSKKSNVNLKASHFLIFTSS